MNATKNKKCQMWGREAINNTTTKRRVLCQTFRNYICLIVIVKRIRSADLLQSVRGNRRKKMTCIFLHWRTGLIDRNFIIQIFIWNFKEKCVLFYLLHWRLLLKNIHNTRLILYFFLQRPLSNHEYPYEITGTITSVNKNIYFM